MSFAEVLNRMGASYIPHAPRHTMAGGTEKQAEIQAYTPPTPLPPEQLPRHPAESSVSLNEALKLACEGLTVEPSQIRERMSGSDVSDWQKGKITDDELRGFARLVADRCLIEAGRRPSHYTHPAVCAGCGPVWLWKPMRVEGCPWCDNRRHGRLIPRPEQVQCRSCKHFTRTGSPGVGHCMVGQPKTPTNLWESAPRWCNFFVPHRGSES
ncbi:hypothetical protein SAMN03097708_00832 [Thiohalomonas denitrificans]|uniref:Uncharacterized protein n=1 Tax=Thiohalomonas denitrificans TaxID=415747 RepID=A0A1G5PTS1_9GAMM|nr:hypothetical protein SAMN03097708_00832 [Thiohalomonas denitrificans]